MKKIIYVSALILAWSGYAQKSQIKFDNQLQYSLKYGGNEVSESESYSINIYYSSTKKVSLFEYSNYYQNNSFGMTKDGKMLKIRSVGLDRAIKTAEDYSFPTMESTSKFLGSEISFVSMNKKGIFNGIKCDYYSVNIPTDIDVSYIDSEACFCIDTTNKLQNLKSIFPKSNIDGLILAYGNVNDENNIISLDAINKVNIPIAIDFDEEYSNSENRYKNYLKQFDDIPYSDSTDYAIDTISPMDYDSYYYDPLCNNSDYFQGLEDKTISFSYQFKDIGCSLKSMDIDYDGVPELNRNEVIEIAQQQAKAIIKQAKKSKVLSKKEAKGLEAAFDKMFDAANKYDAKERSYTVSEIDYTDAAEAVTDPVTWDEPIYSSYQSNYKNSDIQTVSLAAESQYNVGIENNMPTYCSELKARIPNFKDQDLKKHVYNLVGQICDLYLYQNGGDVAYIETIDSMRKSLLEIENKRADLNKNDAKLLKEYLNSLD